MKKTTASIFFLLIITSLILIGCASFGTYKNIQYIDDCVFDLTISVPPIAGGGSRSGNFTKALKEAAAEVIKNECNYFIMVEMGYETKTNVTNSDWSGRSYKPTTNNSSSSSFRVMYTPPEYEEEFRQFSKENGLQIYSAKHIE